jgi:hypothetical protein
VLDEPKGLILTLKSSNLEKTAVYMKSIKLAAWMIKSGLMGKVEICLARDVEPRIYRTLSRDTGGMVMVRQHVTDFRNWLMIHHRVHASHAKADHGFVSQGLAVHEDLSDTNVAYVWQKVSDIVPARAFIESEDIKSDMRKAGVILPVEIWLGVNLMEVTYDPGY